VITFESISTNVNEIYSPDGNFSISFVPQLEILPSYQLKLVLPGELEV
jgi:hypothetical protein